MAPRTSPGAEREKPSRAPLQTSPQAARMREKELRPECQARASARQNRLFRSAFRKFTLSSSEQRVSHSQRAEYKADPAWQ
jgi:hypothetical protein